MAVIFRPFRLVPLTCGANPRHGMPKCGAISFASATIVAVAALVSVRADPADPATNCVVAERESVVPFQ